MTVSSCPNCGYDLEALSEIEVGGLKIAYSGAVILWNGCTVHISPNERLMLLAIVRAGGYPVERSVLAEAMGYEGEDGNNITTVHLHRIKRAFRQIDPSFDRIATMRGRGLRWKVETDEVQP